MAVVSPATYILSGVRAALLDGAGVLKLWQYIWPALLLAVATVPDGLWAFSAAERYAKRNGRLARNG